MPKVQDQQANKEHAVIEIVSGSEEFLSRLVAVVEQQTGVRMNGPRLKQRNVQSSTDSVRISGKRALKLDAWLHSNGLGLERKSLAAKMPQPYYGSDCSVAL